MSPRLEVVANRDELARAALALLSRAADRQPRGPISVLLAGGSTPESFHRAWAAREGWPWWRTLVAFGDERCVPPDHPDSNHRAARAALLDAVAPAAVWRIPAEAPDPGEAAELYRGLLAGLPGGRVTVAFLGMGEDGHTASLFPGRPAASGGLDAIAVPAPPTAPHARITVTESFLARADEVVVLVSGGRKSDRLAEILGGRSDLPLARVLRLRGERPSTIVADAAAAERWEQRT